MANTAIQNIKILHKRYSSSQWQNGITVNGDTIIPMLAQGEIGLATDTLEVRIGTNSSREQTFAEARPIDADVSVVKKNASGETLTNTAGLVVIDVSLERDEDTGKHKLTAVYDKISVGQIEGFPDFAVNATNSITAGTGEVKVITAAEENSTKEHQLDVTYGTAATKAYVDSRKLTINDSGSGQFITDISESNANGEHTITVTRADIEIEIPELELIDNTQGDYVSGITVDDHKITVTKNSLPVGTGSKTAGDDEFISSVVLEGHTLTATSKKIKGDVQDGIISVSKDAQGNVVLSANTYSKDSINAMISEVGKAMKFKGTLDASGKIEGALTSLPINMYSVQGDVYKVVGEGVYNGQPSKIGDLFIYDGSVWRYVPSGDETFTDTWRGISVNGTSMKDNSIGSGDINFTGGDAVSVSYSGDTITISHNDTSGVEDLNKTSRTYVDSLTFDEYGHVTGYTVGAETVVDTNTAHTHNNSGAKIVVTGGGGVDGDVTIAHETITTSTSADSSKNVTITAGSGDNKFTVVDSLVDDGYGHITAVKTKEISVNVPEDKNTHYDLTVDTVATDADAAIHLKGEDNTDDIVKVKGADGTTISVANGIITITSHDTTYELATAALEGLVKVANVLNDAASANATTLKNYTGANNDRLYGVNRRADGTTFVEVPWHDTTYTGGTNINITEDNVVNHTYAGTAANSGVDLYAFGTDAMGHVSSVYAVTTIDGNYA